METEIQVGDRVQVVDGERHRGYLLSRDYSPLPTGVVASFGENYVEIQLDPEFLNEAESESGQPYVNGDWTTWSVYLEEVELEDDFDRLPDSDAELDLLFRGES